MQHYLRYINEGYTEEQAFYLAEIKTTQQILADYGLKGTYMPTMLINSLLSMIVLPHEKAKSNNPDRIFSGRYSVFENQMDITPKIFSPIKSCENGKVLYNNRVTSVFINKLRNGIAHQNISVSIVDDYDFEITIKNKYQNRNCNKCKNNTCKEKGLRKENGGVIDFEIKVNVSQLKRLAEYIANSYINAIETEH